MVMNVVQLFASDMANRYITEPSATVKAPWMGWRGPPENYVTESRCNSSQKGARRIPLDNNPLHDAEDADAIAEMAGNKRKAPKSEVEWR